LWDAYNGFYGRSGETALPAEVTEATWSRFLDVKEPLEALIVCDGREVLAIAHYLFHRSTTSIAPTCYLQDLFTRPEQRGQGIARALVEHVCTAARRAGASRLYWQTHQTNKTARSLYDKIAENTGFVVYRVPL
jgi:GNAT superfamily N-acetyltransferase